MNISKHTSQISIFLALILIAGCSDRRGDSHASHSHDHGDDHHVHTETDSDHHNSNSHEDEKSEGGPNGGRLITSVTPAIEFIVNEDRTVRILLLDEKREIVSSTNPFFSLIGGDRANPTALSFSKQGQGFTSNLPLPEGVTVPVVFQIKMSPTSETAREKFNVNLSECPSCDYQEYACVCGHDNQ